MKKIKSRILYHDGTLPIPAHFQKGKLVFADNMLCVNAKAKDRRFDINLTIPTQKLIKVVAAEKKYYSSTGYMLEIMYLSEESRQETIEIEIRSFGKRGRTQAITRNWANLLNEQIK